MKNIPNVVCTFNRTQVTHRKMGPYKCFENTSWVTWARHTRARPDTQDTKNNCIPMESPQEGNLQRQHTLLTARGCRGFVFFFFFFCSQTWSRKIPHTVQQLSLHTATTESACYSYWSPCGSSLCSATRKTTAVRSPKPAQRERPSTTKNGRVTKRKESRSIFSSPAPGKPWSAVPCPCVRRSCS